MPPVAVPGLVAGVIDIAGGGPAFRDDVSPSGALLTLATAVAVVAAVFLWVHARRPITIGDRLRTGPASVVAMAGGAAVSLVLAWVLVHGFVPGPHAEPASTAARADRRRQGAARGGRRRARAFLGRHLENEVITPGGMGVALEQPFFTRRQLDARIRELDPAVLVVGRNRVEPPRGWKPEPAWRHYATINAGDVYIRG